MCVGSILYWDIKMERDVVIYSNFVANANWNAINALVSGTCQTISLDTADWWRLSPTGTAYDRPILYNAPYLSPSDYISSKVLRCGYCRTKTELRDSRGNCISCGAPIE